MHTAWIAFRCLGRLAQKLPFIWAITTKAGFLVAEAADCSPIKATTLYMARYPRYTIVLHYCLIAGTIGAATQWYLRTAYLGSSLHGPSAYDSDDLDTRS